MFNFSIFSSNLDFIFWTLWNSSPNHWFCWGFCCKKS